MRLLRLPDRDAACRAVASMVRERVAAEPETVLGFATGGTMEAVYRSLLASGARLERATSFNLDEYAGLPDGDPRSFRATMQEWLFGPAGMQRSRTHVPDGRAADRAAASGAYEAAIAQAGGIALQLLGIGLNGHVGFNEPGSPFASRTRDVTLLEATRRQNAPMFGGDPARVPARAITMGLATILEARRIVLLATGVAKAPVIARLLADAPSTDLPASCLHAHPDCVLVLDAAAASLVPEFSAPPLAG